MYLDHKAAAFSNPPLAQIYPHQRVVENTLNQVPYLMRNPRSNANSLSTKSYREGEYFTTFSHKRGAAEQS